MPTLLLNGWSTTGLLSENDNQSCWQDNRSRFQGTVHPPLFMTISVRDLRYARQIEECIPERDRTAFVFENDQDQQARYCFSLMFSQGRRGSCSWRMCDKLRDSESIAFWHLPIHAASHQSQSTLGRLVYCITSDILFTNYKMQFGFVDYAINLFDAPDAIKRYLASNVR